MIPEVEDTRSWGAFEEKGPQADLCLIPADRNRFRFRSEKLELIPIPTSAEHGHVESIPIPIPFNQKRFIPTPDFRLRNRFRFDSIGRGP